MAGHPIRPMIDYRVNPDGSIVSPNWSGWLVTGTDFTFAQGSWKVPAVDCSQTPNSHSSFWVGFDGYPHRTTVEQTGTSSYCLNSTALYYAWYQFYPHGQYAISYFPVAPSDVISASVTYNGVSNGDPSFTVRITDETTGKSCHQTETVRGALRESAEWIAEAPGSPTCQWPLSDFGTVYFGMDYTHVSGTNDASDRFTTGPIGNFDIYAHMLIMQDEQGNDLAVPSPLTEDNSSFDVVWKRQTMMALP